MVVEPVEKPLSVQYWSERMHILEPVIENLRYESRGGEETQE